MAAHHTAGPEKTSLESRGTSNRVVGQSAMEYLMTYGWAILIIAVILGVLFSLGVFNPTNYAPKVPAGNCHVFRPNGPGTNFNVNLVGTCSGFLPQYVTQFNGQDDSRIVIASAPPLQFGGAITVSMWIYASANQTAPYPMPISRGTESAGGFLFDFDPSSSKTMMFVIYDANSVGYSVSSNPITPDTWYFLAGTFDGSSTISIQLDGTAPITRSATQLVSSTSDIYIGQYGGGYDTWNGSVANVQIYNASLDANEIQYLYNEGIGGAPIYLSHLVGWWPLNGDAKDYSGNGNDGTPYNMSFNGSWTSGYSQP